MFDSGSTPDTHSESTPAVATSPVRLAVPADEGAILDMLHDGHAENGAFSFDDERALAAIRRATRRQGGMIGIIDGPDGTPAASIYIYLDQLFYTTQWHLSELWAFVRKEYRASSYATNLLEWAKHIADQMQLPLTVGLFTTKRLEAKTRLYRRRMKPLGVFFAHGLDRADGPLGIAERDRD